MRSSQNLVATNITAYMIGNALPIDTTAAVPAIKGTSARLFYAGAPPPG